MGHCCEEMRMMVEEENSIVFIAKSRKYGVPIADGGSSFLLIRFCPWCGRELPAPPRED